MVKTGTSAGRAADQIVRALEGKIRTGQLVDGNPLPSERELMEEFSISRTVVREAVQMLSGKGLVETRPRFRPVVRKPGVDTAIETISGVVGHLLDQPGGVRNLFETRIMVEAALVRQAAKEATRDDISALKYALDENRMAINDSELFYLTDTQFHAVFFNISRNPVLPAVQRAYTTWLAPHWMRMPRLPDRNRRNYEAHKAIFEAILMRDPDAAEDALRAHLAQAWAQVRATFGEI
ncbi:FCD domain-containing protein [Ruegeria sp. 2012CJ41-6]|uniref:FCD domain-containing protein n=1 Tax=Ruegeria spongiae TaxID=2942209 RepID=A0ABT0Q0F5_9RHOB|nr:FCD domain-containing protein [Ruegeria spongiae]MCL6283267.1 FCD domain-containing protein [Ruegeria spongiae]